MKVKISSSKKKSSKAKRKISKKRSTTAKKKIVAEKRPTTIVVTSTGPTLDSIVDTRFGRCAYFIAVKVVENKIKGFSSYPNKGATQFGGAGIVAAQQALDLGAEKIIAGAVGPNAMRVFSTSDVEIYAAPAVSVKSAVEQLIGGKLRKITSVVQPGFGGGRGFGRGLGGGRGAGRW